MSTFVKYKHLRVLSVFLLFQVACSLGGSSSVQPLLITTCSVPADQSGTIAGHWLGTPIPLAFHQGDFSTAEIADITKAADTWNTFYTASLTIPAIFDYGSAASPRYSSVADATQGGAFCAQGITQGAAFSGNVVIYKLGTWPTAYPATAIAITNFCPIAATPYPSFYQAVIQLNYQSFFIAGKQIPDRQSIVLHELGHLLGLKHSCEAAAQTGMPSCSSPTLNPDYVSASMFPVFTFDQSGVGQVKQSLGTNDESRANCLYTHP